MQLRFMNTEFHFNSKIAKKRNSFVAMLVLIHKGSQVKINMQINSLLAGDKRF